MEIDNEFWEHSVHIYKQSGVEKLCLRLQNEFGMDVNFVLFCHWLKTVGLTTSSKNFKDLVGHVKDWRVEVIQPLRNLRISLQAKVDVGLVRKHIILAELKAEQYQQALIWSHYKEHRDNYVKTESVWYELLLEGRSGDRLEKCKVLLSKFPR